MRSHTRRSWTRFRARKTSRQSARGSRNLWRASVVRPLSFSPRSRSLVGYRVITQRQAEADIVSAFDFIVERGAPEAAIRWYRSVKAEIDFSADMPARGATAPESEKLGFEIRQIHFGKRTGVYRILFRVLEE